MSEHDDDTAVGTAAPDSGAAPSPFVNRRTNAVTVKLERFDGPLDLLLHLIKRDEVDIYDIPIAQITQQYLHYIELMRQLDLEVAGEFLVMAATLMRIKAKMLLPLPAVGAEEEPGDPREELVQRLVEYRQFKEAASTLKDREELRSKLHERGMLPGEDETGPLPLARVSLFDLLDALNRVLARVPEPTIYQIQAESFAVEDKIELLTATLRRLKKLSFIELLTNCHTRAEMVVTFIALLEMVKLGEAVIAQGEVFGDIEILAGEPRDAMPAEPGPGDAPAATGEPERAPVESDSGA